ncbi:hypothetical protein BGZ94_003952 [Podila epigama]|nr:hypothetical protein BGZ94_003952 [Podila epigama]
MSLVVRPSNLNSTKNNSPQMHRNGQDQNEASREKHPHRQAGYESEDRHHMRALSGDRGNRVPFQRRDYDQHPDDYPPYPNRPPRPSFTSRQSSDDYYGQRNGPPYSPRDDRDAHPGRYDYRENASRYEAAEYYRERPDRAFESDFGRGRYDDRGSYKRRMDNTSPEPRKRLDIQRSDDGISKLISSSSALDLSASSPTTDRVHANRFPMSSSALHSDHDMTLANTSTRHANKELASDTMMQADADMSSSKHRSPQLVRERGAKATKGKCKLGQEHSKGSSASSASSSSSSDTSTSDSDSNSDASDDEGKKSSRSSRLRVHGEIHDLILELERTRARHAKYSDKAKVASKKIRDISRKLERRFRDLSDMAESGASHSVSENLPSSTSVRAVGSDMKTPSASVTEKISARSMSQNGPQKSSMVASSGPTHSGSTSKRQPKNSKSFAIGSASVVETLSNIHQDVKSKAFARKARSMVMHTPLAGPELEEIMVTSSLDGNIQFWDLKAKCVVTTIPKAPLNQPWAEDMCWAGSNVLAVTSATKEGFKNNHQLTLVHVKHNTSRKATGMSDSSVAWTLQPLEENPHDTSKGGILCMTAMTEDNGGMSLATAGMDKQVIHWRFSPQNSEGDYEPVHQTLVHHKHTSTIQALGYSTRNQILYSGGSDCKILGWDMVRSEIVVEHRSVENGRITHIQENPADPNLFLIAHATTNNQFTLHDSRQRFHEPVLTFGFQCSDNLSRNVAPSWHPGGALVSSGTQSDAKINIWDIRWKDVHRGAGQSICVQEKRVFKAAFHPKRSLMTSMSADGSLAFIDFRLNPNTVVHR